MIDKCLIYIDRIENEESQTIDELLDPKVMAIKEAGLVFEQPIRIKGEANLADTELVVSLSLETTAKVQCSICNELFDFPIKVPSFFLAEPVHQIKSHIFDLTDSLREAILLEIPYVAECNNGACLQRKTISKYLAQERSEGEETWRPFKDLPEKEGK